jgi:hypothetical protein
MADRPQGETPRAFADRVFGGNPFPKGDTRHELWETAARYAAEKYARIEAKWLKRLPSERAQPEEFMTWIFDSVTERYDVLCSTALIFIVHNVPSVANYEAFLAQTVKFIITSARANCPRSIPKELFLSELQIRFRQRTAHWTAEALKLAREAEQPRSTSTTGSRAKAEDALQAFPLTGADPVSAIEGELGAAPAQPTTKAEDEIWGEIDRDFVQLMVDRLEGELDKKYASRVDQIRPNVNQREPAYLFPVGVARLCVERTKESISELFRIYCEVWEQHQSRTRTASFVRAVFARALLPCLDQGTANARVVLDGAARRHVALGDDAGAAEIAIRGDDIIQDASKLKQEWQNRIEIEAKALEWKQKNARRRRKRRRRDKRLATRKPEARQRKTPGAHAEPATKEFEHSDDYRRVRLRKQEFYLTSRQAQIVERLHQAHISGKPELSTDSVMSEIGTKTSRLRDSFRSRPDALKALVARPRRGFVRLNL